MLAQIPGLTVREMNESALCCGSAGIYNLTQPEMAGRLGARKAERIMEVEPDLVITANPGCAIQMAAALRASGSSAGVRHIVDLIDESYAAADAAPDAAS